MSKSRFTRRGFLQRTAGVAGASLVGGITVLKPEPLPAFSRYGGASDKVRFGIAGVGMEGTGLLTNAIQLPGVECVAACDLYDGRHELAKEIVGKPIKTTRRYKELLHEKDIDAIIIAVPDHWHKQVVVDSVGAGKDVYCEKPMSHGAADGVAMVAAANKTDRIVQIGAQRTSSVLCAKAKELLASGAIGELSLVEGSLGRNDPTGAWEYPPPADLSLENLDWDTWLGTAPSLSFRSMALLERIWNRISGRFARPFAEWDAIRDGNKRSSQKGVGLRGHLPLERWPQYSRRASGFVRIQKYSGLHALNAGHGNRGSHALHGLEGHHRADRVRAQLHTATGS